MKKTLTIVIPTYNMEALLPRCLDSFIIEKDQMDMLEIIVVNDGSKDNSSNIAHKYADKYPNTFQVIDKPNGNYGSCINAALKVAIGKYFKICDADDLYFTDNLSSFISFLEKTSTDMVFSPYLIMDFDENIINSWTLPNKYLNGIYSIDDIDWSDSALLKCKAMHSIAIQTKVLKDNSYTQTEGVSYTDSQFIFYSVLYSMTCSFFGKNIYKYCLGRDEQTMSKKSMIKNHMQFFVNGERMLNDYVSLPRTISINKQNILYRTILGVVIPFVDISLGYIKDSKKECSRINNLIMKAKQSLISCPLDDSLESNMNYRLWKVYHMKPICIYYLRKLKSALSNTK